MTPWKYRELTGRPPPRRLSAGLGLGAGLLGAVFCALRFSIRPATTDRIPDSISPPVFTTRLLASSRGQMVFHESMPPAVDEARSLPPPLVFIHDAGVGASSFEWSRVYAHFAGERRVLAPDLIGFGESERPHVALRAADHVAVLGEFLRALSGDGHNPAPVLIARGLGAGLCVQLAAEQPELVRHLVLLLPAGRAEVSARLRFASRVPTLGRFVYRNLAARRAAIRRQLEKEGFADPARVDEETVEVHAICAQQYQAGFSVRAWWGGWLNTALEKNFRGLKCPVSLLVPAGAPLAARERAARLAARQQPAGAVATTPLRELPDLGPLAALEAPGVVAAALGEILAADAPGARRLHPAQI